MVTLNFDLQSQIVAPRELHKWRVVVVIVVRGSPNGRFVGQQHEKVATLAHVFRESVVDTFSSGGRGRVVLNVVAHVAIMPRGCGGVSSA